MIQSSDVEILVSQADGGVSLEIVGGAPIEDKAGVIAKLPKGEEQAVAEVCGYGREVWDRNHIHTPPNDSFSFSLVSFGYRFGNDEIWKNLRLSHGRERDLNWISSPFFFKKQQKDPSNLTKKKKKNYSLSLYLDQKSLNHNLPKPQL